MTTPRTGASRALAAVLTTTLGALALTLAGCGGSHGPGGGDASAAAAALSTRTLGALHQETRALPGAAQGLAAANAGSFVLVTGGASPLEDATTRVTELELSSGQTRPRPDALVIPRSGHVMHLTPSGAWLVLGGVDPAGRPLDSVERYDALGERWVLEPLTLPLAGRLTSARTDRYLVLAADGSERVEFLDAGSLEPARTLFLEGVPSAAPPLLHLAGRNEALFVGGEFPCFFDAATLDGYYFPGSWIPSGGAVLPVGDVGVLFVGGRDAAGQALTQVHYLEIATPFPVPVGPQLPPVEGPAAAWLADGTILVAGGSFEGRLSSTALRVDLGGQLQRLQPLGEARAELTVASDGLSVALIGGRAEAGPSALVDLFGFGELLPTQAFAEAARRRQTTIDRLRELEEVRAARAEAEQTLAELTGEVLQTQARLDQASAERDRLGRELSEAEAARVRAEGAQASLEGEAFTLRQEIGRLDASTAAGQRRLSEVQAEQAQVAQALADASAERARQTSRADEFSGQLTQAQGQVAAEQRAISELEAESARRVAAQPASPPPASSGSSFGVVIGLPQSVLPAGVSASQATPAPAFPPAAPAPAPQRPGNASTAPTPNAQRFQTGGVYSLSSVLARLNGTQQ